MSLYLQFLCVLTLVFKSYNDFIPEDQSIGFSVDSPLTNGRASLEVGISNNKKSVDKNGYVVYCPCMGRFGNQAEQFLGAVGFAKGLNRTLILPPWITYSTKNQNLPKNIPFTQWFKEETLRDYHRVITMEAFMESLANEVWPKDKRIGFCVARVDDNKCCMKKGNPFGSFWNHFDIKFSSYKYHSNLLWHTYNKAEAQKWNSTFPPNDYPVLAFRGTPGKFPSAPQNQIIQKFISFSDYINDEAEFFIKKTIKSVPFVGIHLRNGRDMKHACDTLLPKGMKNLFASTQCTGFKSERNLTYEMCHPSKETIIKHVADVVKMYQLKAVFIGSDNSSMVKDIADALKVKVYHRTGTIEEDDPIIDIAIMVKADQFIGNCVSSFSAFIRRQRQVESLPVQFFGL